MKSLGLRLMIILRMFGGHWHRRYVLCSLILIYAAIQTYLTHQLMKVEDTQRRESTVEALVGHEDKSVKGAECSDLIVLKLEII